MGIRVKTILTCEDVEEHENENITYHNTFSKIVVEDIPVKIEHLYLVVHFEVDIENDTEIELVFIDPLGKKIGKNSKKIYIEAQGEKYQLQYNVRVQNFPIRSKGVYTFKVKLKEKVLSNHSFLAEVKGVEV